MKSGKDSRQLQNGNKVTLKIPGFMSNLNIQFPPRRLPVCEKCKRHYKTRNLCRVKKMHTDLPWCKTYLCITLDDSCTDEDGKITPGPYEAKTMSWRPYQFKPSVPMNCDYPMCADCKRKNYTGSYCRGRQHAHRYLPWDTVYVELSSASSTAITVAETGNVESQDDNISDKKNNSKSESKEDKKAENEPAAATEKPKTEPITQERIKNEDVDVVSNNPKENDDTDDQPPRKKAKSIKSDDDDEAHEFKTIDESRTFFLEVSSTILKIQWLDLDEDRASALAESGANNPLQPDREDGTQPYGDHPSFQDPYRHPEYAQAEQNSYYQYGPPPYSIHQPWNQAYYHQYPHQSQQAFNHVPPPIYGTGPPYPQNSMPISQPESFSQYYPPYFASGYGYPMQGTPQRENFTQESPNQGSSAKPRTGYPQLMPPPRESENQESSTSHPNPPVDARQSRGVQQDSSAQQESSENYSHYPGNANKPPVKQERS